MKMKIGELIRKLQKVREKEGNLPVMLYDLREGSYEHLEIVETQTKEDEPFYTVPDKFVTLR